MSYPKKKKANAGIPQSSLRAQHELALGLSLTDVQRASFTGHEASTPALTDASTLGTPSVTALQQDYVPGQASALSFQDQPIVPTNPGPHQRPRFFCFIRGCDTTCNRLGDLRRHYEAQHQSPKFKCPVGGCYRMENPFTRKDKLREHLRNIHNIAS